MVRDTDKFIAASASAVLPRGGVIPDDRPFPAQLLKRIVRHVEFASLVTPHCSVSAGALAIAVVTATPASAADECGTPSGGVVQCDASDAPFDQGIDYAVDGNLTLNVADGLTVAPDAMFSGIVVSAPTGSVVINASAPTLRPKTRAQSSVFAGGDIAVAVDDVSTSGLGAWGITSFTFDGETDIEVDTVTTNGDYGLGIVAESGTGAIRISANAIDTTGFAADGITVRTGGDISVEAGSITGEGDYVWGVNASSGNYVDGEIVYGNVDIDVGTIDISGDHAIGVNAFSYGEVDVKVDDLKISGDYGTGVIAIGGGNVNVEVGDAVFTGDYTGGIVAFSYGEASVKVGTLTARMAAESSPSARSAPARRPSKINVSGDFANGIQSVSSYGDATLKVGEVSTDGFFSIAINGDALKGDLVINAGKITTQGELAMGIRAFGRTSNILVTGPLSTTGNSAFGILNSTIHGDAIVRTQGRSRPTAPTPMACGSPAATARPTSRPTARSRRWATNPTASARSARTARSRSSPTKFRPAAPTVTGSAPARAMSKSSWACRACPSRCLSPATSTSRPRR